MASLVKPTKHLRASLVAHPKGDQSWVFIGRTDAEAETLILCPPHAKSWLIGKDPDAGQDWRQEEKGTTGWDGWMASPTQWTWVWVNSRSWWWTGRPGLLRSMGSQRVGHDWVTEQNWTRQKKMDKYLRRCFLVPNSENSILWVISRIDNLQWTMSGLWSPKKI